MNIAPSFERLNYLTRPNKSVERKLLFETIVRLSSFSNLSSYRYVGFGSMWFADFLFVHRLLGISDMWSIEHPENEARANFNKPYRSINVKPGLSTDVLKGLSGTDWAKPMVAWLDYDGMLSKNVVSDVSLLCENAREGSIIIFSVNANRHLYRKSLQNKPPLTAAAKIRDFLGQHSIAQNFVTVKGPKGNPNEVPEEDFPQFLAESLLTHIAHKLAVSGRTNNVSGLTFVPMFNFCHRDGAEMVTVGGAIWPTTRIKEVQGAVEALTEVDATTSTPKHRRLDLIQLTLKEKIALDLLLPREAGADLVANSKAAGIGIPDSEITKYENCYKHFPLYAEAWI